MPPNNPLALPLFPRYQSDMTINGTTIAATYMTARFAAGIRASVPNSLLLLGLIRGCRVR
jgi:hypothetical protein